MAGEALGTESQEEAGQGACDDEVQEGLRFSSRPLAPCVREAGVELGGEEGEEREVTPIRNRTRRLTASGEGK